MKVLLVGALAAHGVFGADGAEAHGTGARTVATSASVVEFYYADGDAMAYADAKVFSPDAPDVPFFNGRADRLGRVAFAPDREGVWRVEARDNEGHMARIDVAVSNAAAAPSRAGFPWLLWASLALNIFAVATCAARWRQSRDAAAGGSAPRAATASDRRA